MNLLFFLCLFTFGELPNNHWHWFESGPKNLDILELECVASPLELDHDGSGNLFMIDFKNAAVMKWSLEGEALFSFGREGQGPAEFTTLYDISVDKNKDRIWVSDQLGRRIAGFHGNGHLFVHKNMEHQPYSIACRSDGVLIASGTGKTNLVAYNEKLETIRSFGRPLKGAMAKDASKTTTSRFSYITVDPNNNLFVAYSQEPIIACYNENYELVWEKERPWTSTDLEPIPSKVVAGGMSRQGQIYHSNILWHQGVLYVVSGPDEGVLLAFDPKGGQYQGFRKFEGKRPRGIVSVGSSVFSLNGSLQVYGPKAGELSKLRCSPSFTNIYEVNNVGESLTPQAGCCGGQEGSGCSCGKKEEKSDACSGGCCSKK